MHCGVTRPHSHSVHHSWCRICLGGGGGVCVCASCAFQLCARVRLRLRNQTVCERAAAPCLLPYAPIFSLRQSVKITGPPCVGAQTVYLCVREVHERACFFAQTPCACPSGVAMRRCSASSLMASISLWFAAPCTLAHTQSYIRGTAPNTHTYLRTVNAELLHTLAVILLLLRVRGRKKGLYMWSERRSRSSSSAACRSENNAKGAEGTSGGCREDKQVQRGLPVGAATGTVVSVSAQRWVVLWPGCG